MADEIIQLAERLGKAIAASPQAAALRAARKELQAQKDVLATLNEYQQQAQKVGMLEAENKPIGVDDKHKLQQLHDKLVSIDVFKKFTAAQVEYVDLMRRVTTTLRKNLADVEGAVEA